MDGGVYIFRWVKKKTPDIGDKLIPPFNREFSYNGYINSYSGVDDHSLTNRETLGTLEDPGTNMDGNSVDGF